MSLIKTQFSFNKIFGNNDRVRWGILAGVTIIFTILLYPSLVVKKHSYKLGDVATKDTKAKTRMPLKIAGYRLWKMSRRFTIMMSCFPEK